MIPAETTVRSLQRSIVAILAVLWSIISVNPRPAGSATPSSMSVRRDLVGQVQERLQAVGFKPGGIDGALGPQIREALQWFQNTKGLLPTGEIDEKTLDALEVR